MRHCMHIHRTQLSPYSTLIAGCAVPVKASFVRSCDWPCLLNQRCFPRGAVAWSSLVALFPGPPFRFLVKVIHPLLRVRRVVVSVGPRFFVSFGTFVIKVSSGARVYHGSDSLSWVYHIGMESLASLWWSSVVQLPSATLYEEARPFPS
jgi:hypothetical protein